MDIQTKDGILLRGIPEGTPDEVIKERIAKIRAGGGLKTQVQPQEPSFLDRAKRTAGLGARAVVRGATAIPTMMAEGVAAPLRAMTGGKYFESPSAVLDRTLTQAGLPEPGNATERVTQDIIGTMAGGASVAKGAEVLGRGASVAAKPYLDMLSRNQGSMITTGAGAGAGGGIAQESGAGPTGQFAASLAGGASPLALSKAAQFAQAIRQSAYPTPGALGNKAAGPQAQAVIDALKNTESRVPGLKLTAGQASVPANSAEFAAFQKMLTEKAPSTYFGSSGIEGQQQAAKRALVQQIGGTPKKLSEAISARTAASDINYRTAFEEVVKRDKGLRELWKNPYFKDEVREAFKLAKAGGTIPIAKNMTQFLHFVKEGLDARLRSFSNPSQPAISNATKNAILDAKQKLLTWLETKNPAYQEARLAHAAASKPINQMKMGQELERALVAPATETERATALANAIRKGETTVSKATGRPRIEDLTTEQRASLDALEAEFKRNADYGRLTGKGMQSMKERTRAMKLLPTGLFMPAISVARGWVNRALGTGLEKGLEKAAVTATDPKAMARAMAEAQMKRGVPADIAYRAALAAMIEQGQNQ